MNSLDQRIVAVLYLFLGVVLAFVVYVFALGGDDYVFTGRPASAWSGSQGLLGSIWIGALSGWLGYRFRHVDIGNAGQNMQSAALGLLLAKRVIVVGSCLVATYLLWQLARSVL